jgi:DNA processing protein
VSGRSDTTPGPDRRDGEERPGEIAGGAAARELCLWLAAQAAADRGLVGRLVKAHGSFAQVVGLSRSSLALAVRKQGESSEAPASDRTPPAGEAVVTWVDADYPQGLRDLFDPPPALFVRGRRWQLMLGALRERPTVAIVGARHPSPYGLEMAWLLGSGLARAGVNVVSGMALGIDAQAHVGALDGLGRAAAANDDQARGVPVALAGVLGSGVRLAVPRTNEGLFADVARRGVLLSEYGWLLPPVPWRFPARNRLIAALADAVVIVEGRATSGALHTAAFALDLGRDVLAVPGEAGRPLSAGPHRLLRDGAHLCESPDDVLALLPAGSWPAPTRVPGPYQGRGSASLSSAGAGGAAAESMPARDGPHDEGGAGRDGRSVGSRGGPEGRVLDALRRGQHTADQLEQTLGLAPQHVAAALTMLEIDGLLEVQPGGRYRLRGSLRRSPGR